MIPFVSVLLTAIPGLVPVQESDAAQAETASLTLTEPKSGLTLSLPKDWAFNKRENGLMALGEDRGGFVLLVAADREFEAMREDVKALVLSRLDDVVVTTHRAEGVDERGALEEIVAAEGRGVSKLDGADVEFAALLVRSGDTGALVLGAWKDEANAKLVGRIIKTLRIVDSAGEGGLKITDTATGAHVTIPEGWELVRTRKGLLATSPDAMAMAVLMPWQGDFEASLEKLRAALLGWVFKEVAIGEFSAVEAKYHESLGRVVAAKGTAVDRADEKPVEFTALRLQRVDQDRGAVLFGAWKDAEHAKQVQALMASIRFEVPAPAAEDE